MTARLDRSRSRGRQQIWLLGVACICIGAATCDLARAVSIPINCDGMHIGNIEVETFIGPDQIVGGVEARFTSIIGMPPTLAAAAAACGEDHFNWYQVITGDNHPPLDAKGNRLMPPYVDPPPGGYAADPTQTPPFPVLWADDLPWYWNEGPNPPAGTPGFDAGNHLNNQTDADTLFFQDLPSGPLGTRLFFKTWLVSLNADGSFHSFHDGFTWDWLRDTEGRVSVLSLNVNTTDPTQQEYQNLIGGFATKIIPLPPPLMLAAAGLVGVWFRNRFAKRGRAASFSVSR